MIIAFDCAQDVQRRNNTPLNGLVQRGVTWCTTWRCWAILASKVPTNCQAWVKMAFIFGFKTERGVRKPLPDSNLEMGRIDSQWQLTSKFDPFGNRLPGRWQLNGLEILFRFLNVMDSHPLYMPQTTRPESFGPVLDISALPVVYLVY